MRGTGTVKTGTGLQNFRLFQSLKDYVKITQTKSIKPTWCNAPGLMPRLGMVVRQERHWMVMRVALALIPVAATTMPGIFTSLPTRSLFRSRMEVPTSSLCSVT